MIYLIIGGETVSTGSMNLKERAEVPEPRQKTGQAEMPITNLHLLLN